MVEASITLADTNISVDCRGRGIIVLLFVSSENLS